MCVCVREREFFRVSFEKSVSVKWNTGREECHNPLVIIIIPGPHLAGTEFASIRANYVEQLIETKAEPPNA